MYEECFRERMIQLRTVKGVSARDMSLTLGQSESYINKIENGKSMPSMQVFFYICEFFGITPKEFFDDGVRDPAHIKVIVEDFKNLDEKQRNNIHEIIKDLKK